MIKYRNHWFYNNFWDTFIPKNNKLYLNNNVFQLIKINYFHKICSHCYLFHSSFVISQRPSRWTGFWIFSGVTTFTSCLMHYMHPEIFLTCQHKPDSLNGVIKINPYWSNLVILVSTQVVQRPIINGGVQKPSYFYTIMRRCPILKSN